MAEIALFPLNTVLFPGATLPLHIFEERYKVMIGRCVRQEAPFGVVLIRAGMEVGGAAEPFEVGTTARIARVQPLENGRLNIVTVGAQRFRVRETMHDQPYLTGVVEMLADQDEDAAGIAELMGRIGRLFSEYTRLQLALTEQWTRNVGLPKRPGALADHIAARIEVEPQTKQQLLEELSVPRRLTTERRLLQRGIDLLAGQLEASRRQKFGALGMMN